MAVSWDQGGPVLRPVASTEAVTAHLSRLLEKATDLAAEDKKEVDNASWHALDAKHYNLWAAARRSIGKKRRSSGIPSREPYNESSGPDSAP